MGWSCTIDMIRGFFSGLALAAAALAADPAAYAQRHAAYAGGNAPGLFGERPVAQERSERAVSPLALYPTKAEPAYRAEQAKPPEPEPSSEAEPFIAAVREYARVSSYFFGQWRRASQAELGPYVLGRCWPANGKVEILEGLYGDEFQEVFTHEIVHLRHPELSESEVRHRTRLELEGRGISPRWH